MRWRAIFVCAVLLGGAVLLDPVAGQAHAFLRRAAPAVGATVHAAPGNLRLWFTEQLEISLCRVEVVDSDGHSVLAGKLRMAPHNRKELVAPLKKSLPEGRYRVQWKAVSTDRHVTHGNFMFELAN